MKKLLYIIPLACLLLGGCSKFLDVNPKTQVVDADMFKDDGGFQDALYGVYAEMTLNNNSYGFNTTFAFPGIMAGEFTPSNLMMGYIAVGDWNYHSSVRNLYNDVWKDLYTYIGHVNNIAGKAEAAADDIRHRDLYLGEALALRAMLHFDLLRYFAVHITSTDAAAKAKAIPYVTEYSWRVTPYSSVEQVYEYIVRDLVRAEGLLEADKEFLPAERTNANVGGFTGCRVIHLNLYAVQALLARVYWMKGDMENAAKYAKAVIDSEKFPLMDNVDILNYERGAMHMKETVFGIYSKYYARTCYSAYSSDKHAYTLPADVNTLYDDLHGTDARWALWFQNNVPVKFVNPTFLEGTDTPKSKTGILGINVIRIPEMYYIMAEALLESEPATALDYFNEVINSRQMDDFETLTADDIFLERRKEFYGEGQLWFNMKRLRMDRTISGKLLPGDNDNYYKFPILSFIEDDYRDK